MGRNLPKVALWAAPLLYVAVLFYWPLLSALGLGLSQGTPNVDICGLVLFTIVQALVSTLLCLAVGIPGAYLLYRRTIPGAKIMRSLLVVPFVLPTIVVAIALSVYRDFLGNFLVILLAHLFLNFAIVTRTVGSSWVNLDANLESAAALDGASDWKVFRQITLPQLKPAIASSAALVFLYCVTSFGIVLVLGGGKIRSIETEIYYALNSFLDFKAAGLLALVQTCITVAAFVITRKLSIADNSFDDSSTSSRRSKRTDLWLTGFFAVFVILIVVLPLLSVIYKSLQTESGFGLENFVNLGSFNFSIWHAGLNSIRNLVISAIIGVVIGVLVSWLIANGKAKFLELVFLLPLGVSSVVLGFGYLITPLHFGWLVVPLVQSIIAIPLVIRIVSPAFQTLGRELQESAANAGANGWQIWRYIEAPLTRHAMQTAIVYAALTSLGEFGVASLLSFGDQTTLPVVLYQLISRPGPANYGMAMAASALLILLVIAVGWSTSSDRTSRQAR